jgi:hypothetical protein
VAPLKRAVRSSGVCDAEHWPDAATDTCGDLYGPRFFYSPEWQLPSAATFADAIWNGRLTATRVVPFAQFADIRDVAVFARAIFCAGCSRLFFPWRIGRNQGFTDNSDDYELSLDGPVLRSNLACLSAPRDAI